MAFSPRKSHS